MVGRKDVNEKSSDTTGNRSRDRPTGSTAARGVSIGLVNEDKKGLRVKYCSRQRRKSLSGMCLAISVTLFRGVSVVAL